jgi:thioesterase domain-containing protein
MWQRWPCDTHGVTTHTAPIAELQATWLRDIPPVAAMAIEVASYDGRTLTVRAPLTPNRNVHGTAFAGSLYSICVLTGWGATWLALRERGLAGSVVVSASDIKYRKAVADELVCRCTPDAETLDAALAGFAASGRASVPLTCTIDAAGKPAVTFTGTYVIHAVKR